MLWIVIADASQCRFFEFKKEEHKLSPIKELLHPESREKGSDLVSDAPGHYKTSGDSRGTYVPREEPKEVEMQNFAREIAKFLDSERKANHLDSVILIAASHMNGLIYLHLNEQLKNIVKQRLNKDYTHLSDHEVYETLKNDLKLL